MACIIPFDQGLSLIGQGWLYIGGNFATTTQAQPYLTKFQNPGPYLANVLNLS